MRNKRQGFSLVELIAVIGIIGLLLSLLLPAVQSARSAARSMLCSNNLRQTSLAVELYKTAYGRMPSGTNSGTSQFPMTGLLLHLTPYFEQERLFSESSLEFERIRDPFEHRSLSNVIRIVVCPDDDRVRSAVFAVRHNLTVGLTSYLGVNGISSHDNEGVFYFDSKIKDRDITDGLSNTLLLGERPPSRFFDYGWWYAGYGSNRMGTLDHTLGVQETAPSLYSLCSESYELTTRPLDNECSARVFWSLHGSKMHFSFCDMSIHWMPQKTDRSIIKQLSTRSGGEIGPID